MSTEPRFDENALKALFDEVEAPASMETKWRSQVALAPVPAAALSALPEVRRIDDLPVPRPRSRFRNPRLRAAAAVVAFVLTGGGIAGIVAVNRGPTPDPQPSIIETPTEVPSTVNQPPGPSDTSQTSVAPSDNPSTQPGGGPPAGGPPPAGGGGGTRTPVAGAPPGPARGPLGPGEWPDATNTGLPAGTQVRQQNGDLHVTQPGALVADLIVTGTVYVEAPDVTLRRVRVEPPSSAEVGIRQLAPRLRIEDSEVSMTNYSAQSRGISQQAAGLVLQRSEINAVTSAAAITSDATIVDSSLPNVQTSGNATRIILRHNTIGKVSILDDAGPLTDVTLENNLFGRAGSSVVVIYAPYRSGSRDIRVSGNQFSRSPADSPIPVSGWNAQAPGNTWAGNVWFGTSEPVNP